MLAVPTVGMLAAVDTVVAAAAPAAGMDGEGWAPRTQPVEQADDKVAAVVAGILGRVAAVVSGILGRVAAVVAGVLGRVAVAVAEAGILLGRDIVVGVGKIDWAGSGFDASDILGPEPGTAEPVDLALVLDFLGTVGCHCKQE